MRRYTLVGRIQKLEFYSMEFYVNKSASNDNKHEVHSATCVFLPVESNRISLGEFFTCTTAINKAKEHFDNVNGCYFCARLCHEK